jgi:hypothetical protein
MQGQGHTCLSLRTSCSSSLSRARLLYSCRPRLLLRPRRCSTSSLRSCRCSSCLRRSSISCETTTRWALASWPDPLSWEDVNLFQEAAAQRFQFQRHCPTWQETVSWPPPNSGLHQTTWDHGGARGRRMAQLWVHGGETNQLTSWVASLSLWNWCRSWLSLSPIFLLFSCSSLSRCVNSSISSSIFCFSCENRHLCGQAVAPVWTGRDTCVDRPWHLCGQAVAPVWTGRGTCVDRPWHLCGQAVAPVWTGRDTCVDKPWHCFIHTCSLSPLISSLVTRCGHHSQSMAGLRLCFPVSLSKLPCLWPRDLHLDKS